jgi:hypothetical protein
LQLGFLKMLRGTGMRLEADKYHYVFMDKAPYEILGNEFLPFSDIVRIKRVEDVLEKYWNAHRMDHTITYLVEREFPSPFDFFQAFGDFWEQKGWQKIGHQLEDLFTRLHAFLLERNTQHMDLILGLMKYDYYLGHKHRPRKVWWELTLTKEEQASLLRQAAEKPELLSGNFAHLGLSERDLFKHAVVDVLPFDLTAYLQTGEIIWRDVALFAVYRPDQGASASCYTMPMDDRQVPPPDGRKAV